MLESQARMKGSTRKREIAVAEGTMNTAASTPHGTKRPFAAHRALRESAIALTAAALLAACASTQPATDRGKEMTPVPQSSSIAMNLTHEWDKTFPKSDKVEHQKVTFRNRYGITLAADLYVPKSAVGERRPALAVSGPFGAVKEQSSGLYGQAISERGIIALAFDPSYTGGSGGEPRHVASPDINPEDFSAAVDYLGMLAAVDRERIGALGICGHSGMAAAATSDSRIKAVATVSMYDMSRSMSRSYRDSYTLEQRHRVIDYPSRQRWVDAGNGQASLGYHEVPFDDNGNIVEGRRILPGTTTFFLESLR